nr:hypothetical protein [uncultured Rhodopila sp.]
MAVVQIPANTAVGVTTSTPNSYNFAGPNGTLDIVPGAVVSGVITGLAAGDRINFVAQAVTSETLSSKDGNTVLRLYDNGSLVNSVTFQGATVPFFSFQHLATGDFLLTAQPGLDFKVPIGPEVVNLGQDISNGVNTALDELRLQLQGLLTHIQI